MGITRNAALAATGIATLFSLGCDSLIGLKDFEIKSGLGDASTALECFDPNGLGGLGCYSCPLDENSTTDQVINACTNAPCTPFDNASRIPDFATYASRPGPTPIETDMGGPAPSTNTGTDPLPAQLCADLTPRPVYLYGSSALNLGLRTLAQAISGTATLVYQNDTSCQGFEAINGSVRMRGTAQYWPAGSDQPLPCAIPEDKPADIGLCDVSPQSCIPGFAGNNSLVDDIGPAQVFMFTVPFGSSQAEISAEAAYSIYGYDDAGVEPWTDPESLVRRGVTSGVQLTIAASLDLEPRFWRGVIKQRSSEVKPALLALAEPNRALGITSADVAEEQDTRANLRTLAYQQFGQTCAFFPDSTLGGSDKRNVRDGHYELWAPFHFYTRGQNGVTSDPFVADIVSYLTGARPLPNGNTDFITTLKQAGLVPSCAMRVTRAREGARIVPYAPEPSCSCYFDASPPGGVVPDCQRCENSTECPSTAPNCNFGYCEP
jgi:hypothetical protein